MHIQQLQENWTVRALGIPKPNKSVEIPATVPGCVHTDLLAAELIPDPYVDQNEELVQWIGQTDWAYTCLFEVDEVLLDSQRIDLACEGLDTVAKVQLNGVTIGRGENMHLSYRFDATEAIREGGNALVVTFRSAIRYAEDMRDRLGELPRVLDPPFNFIRKMACNFGWDWGPQLTTVGVWRPIRLEGWSAAKIGSVRPLVEHANAEMATVAVHVGLEAIATDPAPLRLVARISGPRGLADERTHDTVSVSGDETIHFEVPDPKLWWPRGHGEQPLYDVTVRLTNEHGAELDAWSGRIGLRTVRLNTDADEAGSKFEIEINGKPVFCRGANWIPDDCFPHRVDEARYRERIGQAVDANMNMLRVWGGGIYERNEFYEVCDELGVMVWQDFLFACAAYPEEEPFAGMVEAEARQQIARLCRHPSLVLWNGNNENIWGYFDWGWRERIGERTWGLGYYLDLLPRLVAELDPSRPYWPGSPYSGSMDLHPLEDGHGNKHVWDAWNTTDYAVYRNHSPRFVSEFGHQAPPTWSTICRAIPEDQRRPDSDAMLAHQKAHGGNDRLHERLSEHFEIPADFDDWLYLMQVNQARAMQTGVEWFRSRQPACMGTLYWQINDCWPVTSWAAVDGYGKRKPLWYATRRFYADRLLTIQPDGDGLAVFAVNDADERWSDVAAARRLTFDGNMLAETETSFVAGPRECMRVGKLEPELADPTDTAVQMLSAACDGLSAHWFFGIDRELAYPEPAFDADLTRDGPTYRLTIRARVLLRDVCIFADRLDPEAIMSDQLITLLPGESATFDISSDRELSLEALTGPPVFQCANRFGI